MRHADKLAPAGALSGVLARIGGSRVKQLWDPKHLLAAQPAKDALPPAALFSGPVVEQEAALEAALRKLQH